MSSGKERRRKEERERERRKWKPKKVSDWERACGCTHVVAKDKTMLAPRSTPVKKQEQRRKGVQKDLFLVFTKLMISIKCTSHTANGITIISWITVNVLGRRLAIGIALCKNLVATANPKKRSKAIYISLDLVAGRYLHLRSENRQ